MNNEPGMERLHTLLSARPGLEDEGFSDRVMEQLASYRRRRKTFLLAIWSVSLGLFVLFLPWKELSVWISTANESVATWIDRGMPEQLDMALSLDSVATVVLVALFGTLALLNSYEGE